MWPGLQESISPSVLHSEGTGLCLGWGQRQGPPPPLQLQSYVWGTFLPVSDVGPWQGPKFGGGEDLSLRWLKDTEQERGLLQAPSPPWGGADRSPALLQRRQAGSSATWAWRLRV